MKCESGFNADSLFGEVIHAYTRKQALEDGYLVDISDAAREAGFPWPLAVTRAVWEDCVAWTDQDSRRQTYQDESGRLWDVVWMASRAILGLSEKPKSPDQPYRLFQMFRVPRDGKSVRARNVVLKIVAGPDDDGNPCMTIMQPGED